jgi:hypothetical protein
MIVKPEHAAAFDRARNHARTNAKRAKAAGLTPGFVAHCYIFEALKLYFECDDARATELATGLTVLAFADQKTGTKDGAVLAEYALKRSTNDPAAIERLRSLSGIVDTTAA